MYSFHYIYFSNIDFLFYQTILWEILFADYVYLLFQFSFNEYGHIL